MTDYLIDQYNAKIEAAMEAKQNALAAATQIWHKAVDEIIGLWQAATTEAAIEMTSALEHRNKMYVEGPPIEPAAPKVVTSDAPPAGVSATIEAPPQEEPHDDHDD